MSDLLNNMPIFYEPKRKNRWFFRFPSELGIQEWTLKSAARPKISQNETEIEFLNTSTWVVGRFIWESITVVLRDAIGPSTTQAVMEWVRLHSESVTGRQGYAAGYKKDVEIEMIDPNGFVVEKWLLEGAMITNADFGDLSMDDDSIAEVSIELRFDRALLLY